MKRHEIQKPLVQSALVLLAVFILIGFVAGSNAHSVTGGIVSIFKGVFFSVLFAIALTLALVLSVVILIAIFLGAVALYSPDSSREMFYRLRDRTTTLYTSWSSCRSKNTQSKSSETDAPLTQENTTNIETKSSVSEFRATPAVESVPDGVKVLSEDVAAIKAELKELQKSNNSLVTSIEAIQASLAALPIDTTLEKTDKLELQQADLSSALNELGSKLEAADTASKDNGQIIRQHSTSLENIDKKIASYVKELADITTQINTFAEEENVQQEQEATSTDQHRIFSYFENQEDKDKLADLIKEAVTKEMTYAETDTFLSKSLPKKLDAIIKEHPSLTKDYIRDCRKK